MRFDPTFIASQTPDREAIVIGTQRWNYSTLDGFSTDWACRLFDGGMQQGDVVAILADNRAEFLGLCWAAQRSGLYYLPVPSRLTAGEVNYILEDSGAKVLVCDPAHADLARNASQDIESILVMALDAPPPPSKSLDAPAAIEGGDMLYTSGTTGKPKGVRRPLSLAPLGSQAKRVERGEQLFGFSSDTRFLSPAPLYHAAPLRFAMNLLRTGACVVGMKRFDPTEALALIEREQITHSQWVPTMFSRILQLPYEERQGFNLSSHQVAIHAGAPCPRSVKQAMIEWWGPILHEYYSGTESVGFTHITSQEWLERPGSVGRPFGCTVHILDQQGQELPPLASGAVYFAGKGGLEYHGDPAKTRAVHDAQGRSTMGDLGYVDEDGFLHLTDRAHFTIISGGVNVYPSEVENALMELPQVADCAVFGLPDQDLGEAVAAVVELNDVNATSNEAVAQRLSDLLKSSLSGPKRPRLWRFAKIERTETGKVQKAALREACLQGGTMLDLRAKSPCPTIT
ncbi:AMP-binding protein [Altererythrobacter lutimaris]|uniref:AMP-binding protein n=1 Tax=Altererythrobacter lutimaris TaxID=2743979 RepID=A0A850HFK6_9SPHN|nr:AMP-binding protein [Altererythrobacter lutimaris]NVE96026.1 AMP-binding protein [Altererythrobacter lutimaris]